MGHFNFEPSLSNLNGTIGENTDFNAENSAKALHKAFNRKCVAVKSEGYRKSI